MEFYTTLLGLEVMMDHGWIVTLTSPERMSAQLSVLAPGIEANQLPMFSIEVADVRAAHDRFTEAGVTIAYPLTVEPWGIERFFALDPSGHLINILQHA
ncbi:MAG: VOC family protein [Acidimicrobiales bacterium]